ncbi:glycosyltransferase [Methylobacterium sp. J-059]|uniref:glycosyltransferase n=1 Tax=Methylobacterium sp. J-059 TaxID=2836643 RepID=UPI001FBB7BA6|nr:glycosyltransferase [Methylobacterium sp. J-059]MCJ2039643.1 glycosyltransferase [Methylobacterium sp. J-059]
MKRPVGYYVHHQGAGHWQRACAIARHLDRPCTLIGTLAGLDRDAAPGSVLDLPDDRLPEARSPEAAFDGRDGAATRPEAFHYAPLGLAGLRDRMAAIAAWIAREDPALIVVDVSVEVALFARLMSVPVLMVRLAGTRTDPPHLEAFRSAERLIAPFPRALDGASVPAWVRDRTHYAGFLGAAARPGPAPDPDGPIVVVFGRGGAGGDATELAAAARAVPDRAWHVLGPVAGMVADPPPNLHLHGWVAEIGPHLARAALVVGGGGDGVVAAVAAAGRRFVCLPEPRAFGEQTEKAAALERLGAAVVRPSWPEASAWPGVVAAGLALDPAAMSALHDPDAVPRLAATIERIAAGLDAG